MKEFMSVFRATKKLNINNLNYLYSETNIIYQREKNRNLIKDILIQNISFAKDILLSFKYIFLYKTPTPTNILFFVKTKNQFDAIKNLKNNRSLLNNSIIDIRELNNDFPWFYVYFISLLFLPSYFKELLKAKGYKKKMILKKNKSYLMTYGFYFVSRRVLKKADPKVVVIANDHKMMPRTFNKAAQDQKIKTVYVQHASINESLFPPLSFDYAFLDGRDAFEKYNNIGFSKTNVYLAGINKFDDTINKINKKKNIDTIGICTNILDFESRVIEVIAVLKKSYPNKTLILRPHPGDERVIWKSISQRFGLYISNSRAQISNEFLERIDLLIAGDSNILLEAALVNVTPVYYDFTNEKNDHYGFLSNGLVEYFNTPLKLINYIDNIQFNKPFIRNKAKYYCATINTEFDGKSAELICESLNQIISGSVLEDKKWNLIDKKKNLKYSYELKE